MPITFWLLAFEATQNCVPSICSGAGKELFYCGFCIFFLTDLNPNCEGFSNYCMIMLQVFDPVPNVPVHAQLGAGLL